MFASQSSELRHTPTRHRAGQQASTGPVPLGSLAVWPGDQPAHQPFPALIIMAPFAARFCWMAGRDRVQIRTAHLKPISRLHVQPPCWSWGVLGLLGLLGRELGEGLRTGGACRDVIIIMAGGACSNRYPSAVCVLVSAARCTALQIEKSVQRQRDHPSKGNEKQMRPIPTGVQQGCAVRLYNTPHQGSIFSGCFDNHRAGWNGSGRVAMLLCITLYDAESECWAAQSTAAVRVLVRAGQSENIRISLGSLVHH